MPDAFSHIRLILGFVVSLGVARLLTGLGRFVQHPDRLRPDALDGGTFLLAIAAIFIASRICQIGFAMLFIVTPIWFIASAFSTLG